MSWVFAICHWESLQPSYTFQMKKERDRRKKREESCCPCLIYLMPISYRTATVGKSRQPRAAQIRVASRPCLL